MTPPADLYRFYAEDGELLYIGCSMSFYSRMQQHRMTSDWFRQVATVRVEHFEDRTLALRAEARAIHAEQPKLNRLAPLWRRHVELTAEPESAA